MGMHLLGSSHHGCRALHDHVLVWTCSGKGGLEVLQHNHDVLTVAFSPDSKILASATLDGQIHLWNPHDAVVMVQTAAPSAEEFGHHSLLKMSAALEI